MIMNTAQEDDENEDELCEDCNDDDVGIIDL